MDDVNSLVTLVIGVGILVLIVGVVRSLGSRRPASIDDAPAGSFLAYGPGERVEYREGVSDADAEECAADRLCEAGGYMRVEHKFQNGSVTTYTPERMKRLGW